MLLSKGTNLISKASLANVWSFEFPSEYVVYDIETTGFSKHDDEIIEMGALRVKDGKVVDSFESYLALPEGFDLSYGIATEVHGITYAMLKGAPSQEEVLQKFFDFVGDTILVGHNISSFDSGFVHESALHYIGKPFTNDFIDTYTLSNRYFKSLPSRRLSAMADHFGVEYSRTHRALDDCKINQAVYEGILWHLELTGERVAGTSVKKSKRGFKNI